MSLSFTMYSKLEFIGRGVFKDTNIHTGVKYALKTWIVKDVPCGDSRVTFPELLMISDYWSLKGLSGDNIESAMLKEARKYFKLDHSLNPRSFCGDYGVVHLYDMWVEHLVVPKLSGGDTVYRNATIAFLCMELCEMDLKSFSENYELDLLGFSRFAQRVTTIVIGIHEERVYHGDIHAQNFQVKKVFELEDNGLRFFARKLLLNDFGVGSLSNYSNYLWEDPRGRTFNDLEGIRIVINSLPYEKEAVKSFVSSYFAPNMREVLENDDECLWEFSSGFLDGFLKHVIQVSIDYGLKYPVIMDDSIRKIVIDLDERIGKLEVSNQRLVENNRRVEDRIEFLFQRFENSPSESIDRCGGGCDISGSENLSFSAYQEKGSHHEIMEDFTVIEGLEGEMMSIFAVFDGHGGIGVAQYLKDNLVDGLVAEIEEVGETCSSSDLLQIVL